jgi:hypothetical protein
VEQNGKLRAYQMIQSSRVWCRLPHCFHLQDRRVSQERSKKKTLTVTYYPGFHGK